jgi:hypothetical protein
MKVAHSRRIKAAKAMALHEINKDRAEANLKPLDRLGRLYWKMHGAEWLEKLEVETKRIMKGYDK